MRKELVNFWTETLSCRLCTLWGGLKPQFRPTGKKYQPGGVVFLQINPGYIGSSTNSEIHQKYKSAEKRDLALRKVRMTQHLQDFQKDFLNSPSTGALDNLCNEYLRAMRELWGWPPGKYAKTIEKHGIDLDSISIVNLAQCPAKDNAYSKQFLDDCWENRTVKLLKILQPRIIVAQGKTAFKYLEARYHSNETKILLGVHHASRASSEENQMIFHKVSIQLNNLISRKLKRVLVR